MKTLFIMRHAKSDWNAAYQGDHERPLNARGQQAAASMGSLLARLEQLPDRVLTSSAERARETIEIASTAGEWNRPIDVVHEFYASDPATVLARIHRQDDADSSLLLVGHEPT